MAISRNMNHSHSRPQDAAWDEYVPEDSVGFTWRGNSYKRAIARSGDLVDALIEKHGDEHTTFLILGDHGHVAPGGMGGASDEVRAVTSAAAPPSVTPSSQPPTRLR